MASGICDSVVCGWLLYADVLDDSETLSNVLDALEALRDDVIGGSVAALGTTNCATTRVTVAFIRHFMSALACSSESGRSSHLSHSLWLSNIQSLLFSLPNVP